jgi:hypothetical protein
MKQIRNFNFKDVCSSYDNLDILLFLEGQIVPYEIIEDLFNKYSFFENILTKDFIILDKNYGIIEVQSYDFFIRFTCDFIRNHRLF